MWSGSFAQAKLQPRPDDLSQSGAHCGGLRRASCRWTGPGRQPRTGNHEWRKAAAPPICRAACNIVVPAGTSMVMLSTVTLNNVCSLIVLRNVMQAHG